MLWWEAKVYDFQTPIYNIHSKRFKRYSENLLTTLHEIERYVPCVRSLMKLYCHQIRDGGIRKFTNVSLLCDIADINEMDKVTSIKSSFVIEQWKKTMNPPYLLLPYHHIDDFEIHLRPLTSEIILSLHRSYPVHFDVISCESSVPSIEIISEPPCDVWKFNGSWTAWILWIESSVIPRNVFPLDTFMNPQDEFQVADSFSLSKIPMLFQSCSKFTMLLCYQIKFVHTCDHKSDIKECEEDMKFPSVDWISQVRTVAPYSFDNQYNNKDMSTAFYDMNVLTIDPENSFYSPLHMILEQTSYNFLLQRIQFSRFHFDMHRTHALKSHQGSDIIRQILQVPNQLVYLPYERQEIPTHWTFWDLSFSIMERNLCHCQDIFASISPSKAISIFPESSSHFLNSLHFINPLELFFTRLHSVIAYQIEPDELISVHSSNDTPMEGIDVSENDKVVENEATRNLSCEEDSECVIAGCEGKKETDIKHSCEIITVEDSEPENQPKIINMGKIVNSYLTLHGYGSVSSCPNRVLRSTSEIHNRHEEPEKASMGSNASNTSCPMNDLIILISEDLLVQSPIYATLLFQKHKIRCVDAPLELPVAFIIDEITGVCLLYRDTLLSRENLKSYIRKLTSIAFKFDTIWIIIIGSAAEVPLDMYASLCQSFAQFPCGTEIRFTAHLSVPSVLHSLCQDAANFATINKGILLTTFKGRSVLHQISNSMFSAHCEFLQLFPSINFFLAARILETWELKRLPEVDLAQLRHELSMKTKLSIERFHKLLHLKWR